MPSPAIKLPKLFRTNQHTMYCARNALHYDAIIAGGGPLGWRRRRHSAGAMRHSRAEQSHEIGSPIRTSGGASLMS